MPLEYSYMYGSVGYSRVFLWKFLEAAESLLLESSSMLKIDMINLMDKLLKIVHNMEHSRLSLKPIY